MKKVSVRDLRCNFAQIEKLLMRGDEIQITRRGKIVARLVPEAEPVRKPMPDFLARLQAIYGPKALKISGAELLRQDRDRF